MSFYPSSWSLLRKEVQDFLRSSVNLMAARSALQTSEDRVASPDGHVAATEALLAIEDLTQEEIDAVQEMLTQLREAGQKDSTVSLLQ